MPDSPASGAHDPHLLDRVLGTAVDPRDEAGRAQAAALAHEVRGIPLPQGRLSGWTSLCSDEYAEAVGRLHRVVGEAWSALAAAAGGGR